MQKIELVTEAHTLTLQAPEAEVSSLKVLLASLQKMRSLPSMNMAKSKLAFITCRAGSKKSNRLLLVIRTKSARWLLDFRNILIG